jgi:hypothetical protein
VSKAFEVGSREAFVVSGEHGLVQRYRQDQPVEMVGGQERVFQA